MGTPEEWILNPNEVHCFITNTHPLPKLLYTTNRLLYLAHPYDPIFIYYPNMSLPTIIPTPTYVIANGDCPTYPTTIAEGGELLLTVSQVLADYQHYVSHIRERIIFDSYKTLETADQGSKEEAARMLRKEWRYLKLLKERVEVVMAQTGEMMKDFDKEEWRSWSGNEGASNGWGTH